MFISYVGALNVGSIVLDFDPEVITNMGDPAKPYYYDRAYSKTQTGCLSNYKDNQEVADFKQCPEEFYSKELGCL
jgi:phosphatidylserine decarboxylase